MLEELFKFDALKPPGTKTGRERRQAHRLYIDFPIEYRVILQESAKKAVCRATIKNISQSGAYLECVQPLNLTQGQVAHFTFSSIGGRDESSAMHLAAKAIVRRIERHEADPLHVGIALEFICGPLVFYQEGSISTN